MSRFERIRKIIKHVRETGARMGNIAGVIDQAESDINDLEFTLFYLQANEKKMFMLGFVVGALIMFVAGLLIYYFFG